MDEEESLNKKLLNIKNSISEIKQEINTKLILISKHF